MEAASGASPFLASGGTLVAFLLPASLGADAGGAAETADTGATGTTSTVVGIGALASVRGHEKLSARPTGALIASPRLRTRVAIVSELAGAGPLWAPKSSPLSTASALSGTTGPIAVGAPAPSALGASEPGAATGMARFSVRRTSCSI